MAVSKRYYGIPTGKIKFDTEEIDNNNSFDPDTGMFQPSDDGVFAFFFNAFVDHTPSAYVYL